MARKTMPDAPRRNNNPENIHANECKEEVVINKTECERQRNVVAKEIWLTFFNEYLYNHGIITGEERLKMNGKIAGYVSRFAGGCRLNDGGR